MEIIRVVNPEGITYMKDVVVPPEGMDKEVFLESLKRVLVNNREGIFLLQAYDGEEIIGVILAVDQPEMKHIFIYQAWSNAKKMSLHDTRKMFMRLVLWADAKGKSELRAETQRNAEAFYRKWGFIEHSKILKFEVTEAFEDKLLDALLKEPDNGSTEQSECDQRPNGTAEGHSEPRKKPDHARVGGSEPAPSEKPVLQGVEPTGPSRADAI